MAIEAGNDGSVRLRFERDTIAETGGKPRSCRCAAAAARLRGAGAPPSLCYGSAQASDIPQV
jgi:hypothetical protein